MISKRKIKVVRIQSRICIGGPAIHSEILSRYMPKDKYETLLLGGALEAEERCLFDELRAKGINIRIVERMRRAVNPFADLRAIKQVYGILRQEKPDIVCTHTAKAGTIGRIAAWLAGVPVILHTFHGHVFDGYFGKAKTRFFILVEKALSLLSDQIIAISPSQAKDLAEKYRIAPAKKIATIRLGFELDRFLARKRSGNLRTSLGLSPDQILLAIIGRIVPIKNHIMMLHVLAKLRRENLKVHLCVVGDGENRPQIEELCRRLGLVDLVHFLGWISAMEDLYPEIDIVVLTSLNEGTPFSIIEAMASSVPVVATNVGGVPDLLRVGKNGLACEVNNIDDMAEKIEMLLRNRELREGLVRNASEFVIRNYHYTRLIKDMDSLYQRLLLQAGRK